MSLEFTGEALQIDGRSVTGTITVETRVTNSSFDNAFGTEYLTEVEFTPGGFTPDKGTKLDPAATDRAVSLWIDDHLDEIGRAFDRQSV